MDLEAVCWGTRPLGRYPVKQVSQNERSVGRLAQERLTILEFHPKGEIGVLLGGKVPGPKWYFH
jgi:hypothetical protein